MTFAHRPDDLEWVLHASGETMHGWRVWLAMREKETKVLTLRSTITPGIIWDPAVGRSGDFYVAEECLADRFIYTPQRDGTVRQYRMKALDPLFARLFRRMRQPCESIPGAHCGCGYNVFLTKADALEYLLEKCNPPWGASFTGNIPGVLLGEVEMAGEVIEHNDHVRASHVRILGLEMHYGEQEVADQLYDVRVTRNVRSRRFGFWRLR